MTALPEAITSACAALPETTFAAGSEIVRAGTADRRLLILIDGSVKVLREQVEVASIDHPGAIFGEAALLLGVPQAATVVTTSPSRFYVIDDGAAFMRDNPDFVLHVSRMLALRVHMLSGYLADLKKQFADHDSHLGMVHDIICGLSQHPHNEVTLGSDRLSDQGP